MKKLNRYDVLALGIIVVSTLLSLKRLNIFPVFVDIFYHMSTAKGFDIAGGIVLHDFWEFAPLGRTHLYPPLLHVIMAFMYEFLPMVTVGKIISFIMFPLVQLSVFFYTREIFDRKTAFYVVLLITIPFNFYRSQALTNATSLVLVLTPLIFWAVEKNKLLSSVILMSLALYTHISMSHIVGAALIIYAVTNKDKRKMILKTLAFSYLLFLPWMIHILINYGEMTSETFGTILQSEIHLIPMFFGFIGLVYCFLKKKYYYLPAMYFLSMIVILYKYPMRFWAHIALGISILGGISLSEIENSILRNQKRYGLRIGFVVAILFLIGFNLFDPVFSTTPLGNEFENKDPTILTLTKGNIAPSLITPETMDLCRIVESNTEPDDIFFITNPTIGCLITSVTGRSQMQGMWHEVQPDLKTPPSAAKLFIADTNFLNEAKKRNPDFLRNLTYVGETERYIVFLQERPITAKSKIPNTVFPKILAYILLFLSFIGLIIDHRFKL